MEHVIGRWVLVAALAAVLPAWGTAAQAAPRKAKEAAVKPPVAIRTAEQAVALLATAQGETLEQAMAYLRAQPDLLPRQEKALAEALAKAPADADLAVRVLELVRERQAPGCAFAGARLDVSRRGWIEAMLFRQADPPRCTAVSEGLGRLLRTLPDPVREPAAARDVSRILELSRAWKDGIAMRTACRFLLAGPAPLRIDTLATLRIARPDTAGECVVQAYTEAAARPDGDAGFRGELLRAAVQLTGAESIPTLRLALDRPDDRALACELLRSHGAPALEGLVFALRTGDARSEGVRACLEAMGTDAMPGVLPLLDHPSQRIRQFALAFVQRFHTPEARDLLQRRFLQGGGAVPRDVLLQLLASYPSAEVDEAFKEALSSEDAAMRRAGMDAVEAAHAVGRIQHLHEIAEEDPQASLRRRALEVCLRLGDASILPLARRMATYEEPPVAAMALRAMGFLGGKEDAPIVGKALGHRDASIAAAAGDAAWLLSFAAPRKGKVEFVASRRPGPPKKVRELSCEGATAKILGKKGPLVLVLPGGPGMDLSWAWPHLADLQDDAVVAFVQPDPAVEGDAGTGLLLPAQIECVRTRLGGGRVVLVSHGLGGTWAAALASALPEAVAGVASILSPLPGRLSDVDDALRAALTDPFAGFAAGILDALPRYLPAAADAYLSRVFAPAMAGRSDPGAALAVAWDVRRVARAREVLDRPDLRVVPAESQARFLWVVPSQGLPQPAADAYLGFAAAAPDRVAVQSWDGCGFLPEVACASRTVKALSGFVRAVAGAGR